MMRILEIIDSSYFPSFKALMEAVFDGKACDVPNTLINTVEFSTILTVNILLSYCLCVFVTQLCRKPEL